MNKSNTLWILATCIVVVGVIIYIANGISNETSGNYSSNNRSETSYSSSSNSNYSSNSYSSPSSSSYNNSKTDNSRSLTEIRKDIDELGKKIENYKIKEDDLLVSKSKYKGNQLKNGSSPFDACFGKGIYSGNATLTIKNGASSDAIVCLYSTSSGRTIRNEYVRKNTSFTMDNIAQGYYKIRVFYGNDWNPTLENSCGTKGFFESDVSFSEFDGTEYFEDSYYGYTIATVTLYAVSGGNASTSRISQSEFFKN
jgi:hypothetical protein